MQINKETIEQLFRQHYLRMYQLAWVLLKDDAASKDVVSEVFADVLNGKTQLGLDNETIASDSPLPSANAGSYLLVCVRHKCLNLLSRQKMKDRVHHLLKADTSPSIVPLEATITEIDRETDKYEAILAYMDTELTPQTRKVLDLRDRRLEHVLGTGCRQEGTGQCQHQEGDSGQCRKSAVCEGGCPAHHPDAERADHQAVCL